MSAATDPSANDEGAVKDPDIDAAHARHWRRSIRLTVVLLVVWAIAGLGCGVWFAAELNEVTFLGFPLGFWFAQQGAIATFVVLILIYALTMRRYDRRLAAELAAIKTEERRS